MSDDQRQHWVEAVIESFTDEQQALRLVGFYEDGEWQQAMLFIGRENLALRHDLAAAQNRAVRLEALLRRYRTETPLGHQPHMIAHEVDEALGDASASTGG